MFASFVLFNDSHSFTQSLLFCPLAWVNLLRKTQSGWLLGLLSFIPLISQNIKDKYKIRPVKAGRFCSLAFTISSSRFYKTAFPSFVLFTTVILSLSRCFFVRKTPNHLSRWSSMFDRFLASIAS